jgi:hypothetical protein
LPLVAVEVDTPVLAEPDIPEVLEPGAPALAEPFTPACPTLPLAVPVVPFTLAFAPAWPLGLVLALLMALDPPGWPVT